MSFGHGKNARAYMSGYDMSNYLNSIDTTLTALTAETTVFNSSGYKSYVGGGQNKDATLTANGLFDSSTGSPESTLHSALGSTNEKVWTIWPQGSGIGNYGSGLKTIKTGYNITTPFDNVVSIKIDAQSNYARERIVSLMDRATQGTSGVSTANDNTAATTKGGIGYFQRFDRNANTATVLIQHSSGGAYTTLLSFTASTGINGERVPVSGSVKRYTRVAVTFSSTLGVTYHVGFSRK